MKIGDLFDHDFDPNIARAIFKAHGVWPYPFSMVSRDPEEGYFIDWRSNPVDLPIEDVSEGDKVADQSLNMTPYWMVEFVDEASGRIFLKPIEPNPFVTGVGAGGAVLTEADYEIFSGEAETKIVDRVLDRINEGLVATYSDIKYPLLGTVALRFGPNGGEGGWYAPTDLWSNRGGKEGLSEREIMVRDAQTIQKLGLPVPPAALEGRMDPHLWGDLVNGNSIFRPRENPEIMFPGEDWDDPYALRAFILNHPLPQVKERNLQMLKELWNPRPVDLSPEQREAWWAGEYADPELTAFVKQVLIDFSDVFHGPQWDEHDFDPYWKVKEEAIETAKYLGWTDVLEEYEDAPDADNRRYVADAYQYLRESGPLLRMAEAEENPQTMKAILRGLDEIGVDIAAVVSRDPERVNRLRSEIVDQPVWNYHASELDNYLRRRLRENS